MKIRTLDDAMIPLAPESLGEWEEMRKELTAELKFSSSIDLLKHDAPLNAEISPAGEYDGFVIEKVVIQTLPGFYLAGNLYRPKDTTKKYPAVLQPHGHWDNGRLETVDRAMIPTRCANFALRGMVAFIYDMIGYNDTDQINHWGFDPEYEKYNYSRFSLQLNNSVKAIDFVSSLPYVDAERIGCTGCSGGGTQTYFITALDERVKAAAPINMSSAYMQGGCRCENTAFLRTEHCNVDYTMMAAPRPLFMAACDGDWTLHSEEVEFPAIRKVYSFYGAENNFETFYRTAPHCYEQVTRERAYKFFCRAFGIDDPFDGEIAVDIDLSKLTFGGMPEHEGMIHSAKELFGRVKELIRTNLAKADEETKKDILRRVFVLDKEFDLDIPYTVTADGDKVRLGDCPAAYDHCGARYYHTYNYADDTKRVNALVHLMRQYPDSEFVAEGKSAILCGFASEIAGHPKTDFDFEDGATVSIPGLALTELI